MLEINGFEIKEFNIYGLKEGARDSTCPLCSHKRKKSKDKCASLDWSRGLGTCHHCGEVFQLHTFTRKTEKEYVKPLPNDNTTIDSRILDYFSTRGISRHTLEKAKVTTKNRWIEFNYYANNELINVKSRNAEKKFFFVKGAERIFYNIDSVMGRNSVVIVEGEIDALSAMEAGFSAVVSVPNGANPRNNNLDYLDNCIDYFEGITKFILATDNDEAGAALQKELIRRLSAEFCYICDFGSFKDLNEILVADGVDELRRVINSATIVPVENVKTINEVDFEKVVHEGFAKGYTAGLESIDKVFSILDHQFCVVTGIPSSGKSDFVDAYCLGLNSKYAWKTAYASPENFPIEFHAHKLFRKVFGSIPVAGDIPTEKYKSAKERVNDNFYFMDLPGFNLDDVLKKGAELVRRKGIKCLVIDPFNKIKLKSALNDGVNEYTNKYLNCIDEFARKYHCFVFLVAHPVKLHKKEDGTFPIPTFYDVKGGGEFYDMAPNGLAVHRDYITNSTIVRVLKVKFQFQGENNAQARFEWDKLSGNYISKDQERLKNKNIDLPW